MAVLGLGFMQHAIIAALLSSVALGVVGTLVVVKREVFISAGIAHSSYAGIGLGFFLGMRPEPLAALSAVIFAVGMGLVRRFYRQRTDTLIGAMWAVGMGTGALFVDLTAGFAPDAGSYLFGSLLTVPTFDLVLIGILDVIIVAVVAGYYRPLLAHAFDPDFVRTRNIPVLVVDLVVLVLVALSVVAVVRVSGIILMIAVLTMPAALAGRLVASVRITMMLAGGIAAGSILGGLALSYLLDLATGPAVVAVTATVFFAGTAVVSRGRAGNQAGA